jgi:asparaginyl-tRNA synthetase|tara:strand:+ start:4045 stop:5334 length:1290 start_codon:yes stop_codon:yes gene_type:complete
MDFIPIKQVLTSKLEGKKVAIRGWVYRERKLKDKIFLVMRDVSGIVQAVVKTDSKKAFTDAQKVTMESSVELTGKVRKDDRAPTGFEIDVDSIEIIGRAERFPITRDKSEEYLLDIRHLWVRSRKLTSVFKIRSTMFAAIHEYFRDQGFYEVQAPIFTPTACEGGSSQFKVDYFGKPVFLAQSWQLYAEALIPSLEKIYCIAPSFRAEKSKTSRHLTEYWHAEMEIGWGGLEEIIKHGEGLISHICKRVAEEHPDDLKELGRDPKDLLKIKPPFPHLKYKDAVQILKKDKVKFKDGDDIRPVEGAAIAKHYDKPFFVTHFPADVMAFYKSADPKDPKLALGMDLYASEIGTELIGGSQRSLDISEMKAKLKRDKEDTKTYDWYFDTRRFGAVPHAGFGFGVERCLQWICKLPHIRDTIPFPRTIVRTEP